MATRESNVMRRFRRFGGSALLAALATGAHAQELEPAPDRLRIELLPVYVVPNGGPPTLETNMAGDSLSSPKLDMAGDTTWPPLRESFVLTHEAMGVLGVGADEYDLVLAKDEHLTMQCTAGVPPTTPSVCDPEWPNNPQANGIFLHLPHFPPAEFDSRNRPAGTVLLMVLVLPDRFALWAHHGSGGRASYPYNVLSDRDHWTQSQCVVWAFPDLRLVAHEVGHCFGLDHNRYGDRNFDGVDSSLDVMQAGSGTYYTVDWLRPSNQARVRHFFRDLTDDEDNVLPPGNEAASVMLID